MATSSSNAVATFSSVFSITMDPNAGATLTSGMAPVVAAAEAANKRIEKSRVELAAEADAKIAADRIANIRAAAAKLRTIEAEEAAWRESLAAKAAAQAATRGLGMGGTLGAMDTSEAAWRAQLAAKHAQQMARAGLGMGLGAGRAKGLDEQLQADNAALAAAAEWRERLAAKHAQQMASAGLGAGGRAGVMKDLGAEDAAKRQAALSLTEQRGAAIAAMQAEKQHLLWSVMTEKEKFVIRKQADLDHLAMLMKFAGMTQAEHDKLALQAGRLGLGNIPGDNNMRNRGFTGAMIAQQLGFGVQDFMSQMTNAKTVADGMGRGIMALSNNVQMMGAAWGPVGLAVTAIGGTLVGLVIPAVIKMLDTTKQQLELEEKRVERQRELAELQAEAQQRASDIMGRGHGGEPQPLTAQQTFDMLKKEEADARKRAGDAQDRVAQLEQRASALMTARGAEVGEAEAALRRQMAQGGGGMMPVRLASTFDAELAAIKAELAAAKTEAEELIAISKTSGWRGLTPEQRRQLNERKTEEEKNAAKNAEKERLDSLKEDRKRQMAELDAKSEAENERQDAIRREMESLREMGITPSGPSAMSIAGTSAAASAINRALAGTRSEESDRKRQIKIMEQQLKSSQEIEREIKKERNRLAKADLGAA